MLNVETSSLSDNTFSSRISWMFDDFCIVLKVWSVRKEKKTEKLDNSYTVYIERIIQRR